MGRARQPYRTLARDARALEAFVASGGVAKHAAAAIGVDDATIRAAVESPSGVRLLAAALEKHQSGVEEAFGTLRAGMQAVLTTFSRSGEAREVPDYRARVMAAGKLLDVAMKIDDLADKAAVRAAGRRDAPVGRLLTYDELMAMTPYDRQQAVINRTRVSTGDVIEAIGVVRATVGHADGA